MAVFFWLVPALKGPMVSLGLELCHTYVEMRPFVIGPQTLRELLP